MEESKFLKNAIKWFITIKAPDLADKVKCAYELIEKGHALEEKHRKLFGFILFDYSMLVSGPLGFTDAEKAA